MNKGKSRNAKEAGKDEEKDMLMHICSNIEQGNFTAADLMIEEGSILHEKAVDAAANSLTFLGAGFGKHAKASEIIEHYEVPESAVDAILANRLASGYEFHFFDSEVSLGDVVIQGERADRIRRSAGKMALEEILIRSKRNRPQRSTPKEIIKNIGLSDQEVVDVTKEVYNTLVERAAKAEGKDLSKLHAIGIEGLELNWMSNAVQKMEELGNNPLRRLAAETGIPVKELRRGTNNERKNPTSKVSV